MTAEQLNEEELTRVFFELLCVCIEGVYQLSFQ